MGIDYLSLRLPHVCTQVEFSFYTGQSQRIDLEFPPLTQMTYIYPPIDYIASLVQNFLRCIPYYDYEAQ